MHYLKHAVRPRCLEPEGCPIEDAARSAATNRLVEAFMRADGFAQTPGFGPLAEQEVRESGLAELGGEVVAEMRAVLAEYREWKRLNKLEND